MGVQINARVSKETKALLEKESRATGIKRVSGKATGLKMLYG